jgi:DNA-nicking Smr family endonuclease
MNVNFKDILDTWESSEKKKISYNKPARENNTSKYSMEEYLKLFPPEKENIIFEQEKIAPQRIKNKNYRRMKIQETLDLHGFKLVSARVALEDFIKNCKRKKIEKILIIHGKGLHSESGDSVLRKTVKDFLMNCPDIGEIGHPSEKDGGFGATWAIIRY